MLEKVRVKQERRRTGNWECEDMRRGDENVVVKVETEVVVEVVMVEVVVWSWSW